MVRMAALLFRVAPGTREFRLRFAGNFAGESSGAATRKSVRPTTWEMAQGLFASHESELSRLDRIDEVADEGLSRDPGAFRAARFDRMKVRRGKLDVNSARRYEKCHSRGIVGGDIGGYDLRVAGLSRLVVVDRFEDERPAGIERNGTFSVRHGTPVAETSAGS